MIGLHPCSVNDTLDRELEVVENYLQQRKFIGIGESGLDFYWDLTYKEAQYKAFEQQITWAITYDLPIVIHSRNAIDECIHVIDKYKGSKLRGVFHCFSGTLAQAEKIIDNNFYVGIGGVLTFKKSGLGEIVKQIPLDHVILETDAPYLAPVPFRGKRNEPAYLPYIANKLAEVNEIPIEKIAHITTTNAQKLFKL